MNRRAFLAVSAATTAALLTQKGAHAVEEPASRFPGGNSTPNGSRR
jgi:hypothetical protein